MITQRAVLVGTMGFCFYLILLFNNNLPNQFYALSWLSVGVLVSSFGVALLALSGLECRWRIAKARVAGAFNSDEGEDAPGSGPVVEAQFGNAGSFHKTGLLFEVRLSCPRRDEEYRRKFLIEALPAGASIVAELPLADLPRGRYRLEALTLHGGDVLGLFRTRRRLPLPPGEVEDLVVGPPSVSLSSEEISGAGQQAGHAARAARGQGHGDDFRGTRLYVPGDDLRNVHWKSTARLGQLVVREFHDLEARQRVVVWDGAVLNGPVAELTTEYGLCLVMSLCRTLAEQGRACGVLRLDRHPVFLPATRSGAPSNLGLIAEALADAQAARTGALSASLGGYLRHFGTGSEVVLVTASSDDEVARAALTLRARGAHVAVVLVHAAAFQEAYGAAPMGRRGARAKAAEEADFNGLRQNLLEHGLAVTLWPEEAAVLLAMDDSGAAQRALVRSALRSVALTVA